MSFIKSGIIHFLLVSLIGSLVVVFAFLGFIKGRGNIAEEVYVPVNNMLFVMEREPTAGGNRVRKPQGVSLQQRSSPAAAPVLTEHTSEMCSRKRCICTIFMGRLGNLMFQYASLVGIARMKGMFPVIPEGSDLFKVFNLNIATVSEEQCLSFERHGEARPCAFDESSVALPNQTADYTLFGYYQSWRYFENVTKDLRQQFRFKDEVLKKAEYGLRTATARLSRNRSWGDITFVGIHIRRGDMTGDHFMRYGYNVAPEEYFLHAMHLFRKKFSPIMFIICSDDKKWSIANIPQKNDVMVLSREAEVDMATLALCNHTIMSVGSFGWWAAWLAEGSTVYYKYPVRENSTLGAQTNLSDYMYPSWIGME